MSLKIYLRGIGVVLLISFIAGAASYSLRKYDAFSAYRTFIKLPLAIKEKHLRHYAKEERMIRNKLKLELSERERSILAGLHWVIRLTDEDTNFDFFFSDFMLLLNTLSQSENRVHQREVVSSIAKSSLARAGKKLHKLFSNDEESRASFIGILQSLNRHPEFKESYFKFYRQNFGPLLKEQYEDDDKDYQKAIATSAYHDIFNFLIQGTYLHYYLVNDSGADLNLPEDKLQYYLEKFEDFNYNLDHPLGDEFRSLGYLATHVVLALTNYGEFALKEGVNKRKVQSYIEASFDKARALGDFDLFTEYIWCLKLFNPRDPRIKELENFIFALQRPDGSWGSKRDFTTNPYTAIHPSGAALMTLNQSNIERIP